MTVETIGGGNPGWSAVDTSSFKIQMPMFDPGDEGAGGGEGQPAAGGTGQPGVAGGTGTQQLPNTNANGGGQQPGAGAGGQGSQFSYKEDRSDWLPRHRYNEAAQRAKAIETEREQLRSELEAERKRTRALAGVETPNKDEAELQEMRTALLKVYPNLAVLEKLKPEQIDNLLQSVQSAQEATKAQWERHATSMLSEVEAEAKKGMGIAELTPKQTARLYAAYREEVMQAVEARKQAQQTGQYYDATNDALARHNRGDRSFVTEFVKGFLGDFYEPARRVATANVARGGMRPVPRGERTRNLPAAGQPKIDLSDPKAFGAALIAARNGGGRE